VGLQLVPQQANQLDLGAQLEQAKGSAPELRVQRVTRHGPASAAGLMVGDELLAIDGERVRSSEQLAPLLSPAFAGRERRLVICRDDRLRELAITPGPVAVKAWSLVADPAASAAQVQARQRWLLLQAP
jgi:predicted metalloprotease with PDZ domain